MHKNTLWFIVAILCIYFSLLLCEEMNGTQELVAKDTGDLFRRDLTELIEEGRTRKHRHHLYSRWGWHALAIAYLIKAKVVIVSFFVGGAVWLGFRYLWPQKCSSAVYKESGIILDHPPSFIQHDHVPYSFDHDHSDHYADHHQFDTSSWGNSGPSNFEPYSAYSGPSYDASDVPPSNTAPESHTFRRKRDVNGEGDKRDKTEQSRQRPATEEQIGNIMLNFLGLDTVGCRRRFICEMEFRSKANPFTAMAFRVVGRSFFGKYTNDKNEVSKAGSFEECAVVNSECVFIENDDAEEPNEGILEQVSEDDNANTDEAPSVPTIDDVKEEEEDNSLQSNNIVEKQNILNIKAELRNNSYRRRVRGDRYLQTQ